MKYEPLKDKERDIQVIYDDGNFVVSTKGFEKYAVKSAVEGFEQEIKERLNAVEKVREFASDHALVKQEKKFENEADIYRICLRLFKKWFPDVLGR